MWDLARIIIEVVSATACFILVWFMIKPYQLTGEGRYLGLPLGFLFLGVSFTISSGTILGRDTFHTEEFLHRVNMASTFY